jgi:hypothetical protein
MAHENTSRSPLNASVVDSCSILHINEFHIDLRPWHLRRRSRRLSRNLRLDGVPNILLKNLPRRAVVYLTYVFNSCIKLWYFPKIWNHASAIRIPKPGKDHSNPSNYRPISLLSSISKVLDSGWPTLHPTNWEELFSMSREEGICLCPNPRTCYFLTSKKLSTRFGMRLFFRNFLRGAVTSLWLGLYSLFWNNVLFKYVLVKHSLRPCNIPYGVPQGAISSPTLYYIL